jgi:TetR/AcrR family transcriptional regulator, regulator of cefoperazone and chloramphenicol sensitivity
MRHDMDQSRRSARADGAATRARILESAGTLFAAQGFARTESKAVADRAGVDLASINYHFGSREGLLGAVLVEAHQRIISLDDLTAIARGDMDPAAKLDAFIGRFIAHVSIGQDWTGTLLARHVLVSSGPIGVLHDAIAVKRDIVIGILSDITGIPAEAPELTCCLLGVVAPCAMLLLSLDNPLSPMHERLTQVAPADLARQISGFVKAGLAQAAADYAARA